MPSETSPRKFHMAVQEGFKRLSNFRAARLMFIKSYVGSYYDKEKGMKGQEPLNLTFMGMSAFVPNLVMEFPKHVVTTRFTAYRNYARLLRIALDVQSKEINLRDKLRRWLVDALFTMGIMKTGLCQSDSVYALNPFDDVDAGQVYTENVSFDNFVFDANTTSLEAATFIGDRITVPRTMLLDSGLYANDIVEKLESVASKTERETAEWLSKRSLNASYGDADLHDEVEVVELYVPSLHAIVTVPYGERTYDKFLRVADFYGPDLPLGPYTTLALTPPVPDNPLPVAPVGVWYDLTLRANEMVTKVMDQASRQRDILTYKRAAAEDAEEIMGAKDGDAVAVDDPASVRVMSFGGQKGSNEAHIQQLMFWWNMVSGNVDALSGGHEASNTATQAQLLSANRSVRLEDAKDIVYAATASEASKRAWYLHTDPLINLPLTDRRSAPAQWLTGANGQSLMVAPSRIEEVQVMLTPEVRRGDFMNFQFDIKPKSMTRLDPALRLQRMLDFGVKILPAAASAAQICMQMGVPFSFSKFVQLMAEEADIEWMDEVFYDPEFQQQMAMMMMRAPAPGTSKGVSKPMNNQVMQNGQPANVPALATNEQIMNAQPQQMAAQGQAAYTNTEI